MSKDRKMLFRKFLKAAGFVIAMIAVSVGCGFPEQDMALQLARHILTSSDIIDHLSLNNNVEVTKVNAKDKRQPCQRFVYC